MPLPLATQLGFCIGEGSKKFWPNDISRLEQLLAAGVVDTATGQPPVEMSQVRLAKST